MSIGNFFQKEGGDFTKSQQNYYPLIINLLSSSGEYESNYYIQFKYFRGQVQPWGLQVLKQKIIIKGSLFELSEAFGLNSTRTDDSSSQECVICLTNQKDTIAKPCKHVSLCSQCAQVVFNSDRKCPVCRQNISEIIPFKITTTGGQ